ncbi:spermidine/putrescine ABC transporter substrate-binding protein [Leucobacter allii]|uniref:Spermidine/putrescine ABC transporter substrate-binding protein n=1 Tax=Leucobacter allii TaxID=2932247 RepID=A0ABY4FJT4_9MICO|nr:spermidine/putrescine ABC transporter substrate-binding protein [Leucobacter allii]UOQ56322.1 spermidine/putrescine ABC transporter substrate-binding protein [Leucobacter allii]
MRALRTRARLDLSRRDLFRLTGVGIGALGVASLASCAGAGQGGAPLVWGNWTMTMDYDDESGAYPTLEQFTEESGIAVDYFEDINDSATFYAKIREQLDQGQFPGYDLFNFADDFTARLIANEQVQEFDHSRIPNLSHMSELMAHPSYDPDRKFSIPWMGGMTGLCYNTELYPRGIRSVADLARPELRGKVGILTEMIDTIGLTLLDQGVDVSGDWGDAQFDAALDQVHERLTSGQYAQATGNQYTQDLQSGRIWAAMCWSGDIQVLNDEAGKELFAFVIPEPGGTKYVNAIQVPRGTDRMPDVEALIDFYYQPEIMARVVEYTASVPPVDGVREELAQLGSRLAESPMLFPSEQDAKRIFDFRQLTSAETKRYVEAFVGVINA